MGSIPASILEAVTRAFTDTLGDGLYALYLHGSGAMGCWNPNASDIDLLGVIAEPLGQGTVRNLVAELMRIEGTLASPKGIEVSLVLAGDAGAPRHPVSFELHYSPAHRGRYAADPGYRCGPGEDPDLAAHFTVARGRGVALYGPPPREALGQVDPADYLAAIGYDLADAGGAAADAGAENIAYHVLNICRTLRWLADGGVWSKAEGGEWGAVSLPQGFRGLAAAALGAYLAGPGEAEGLVDQDALFGEFVAYAGERLGL